MYISKHNNSVYANTYLKVRDDVYAVIFNSNKTILAARLLTK